MRRREFITLVGGASAWPLLAGAQKAGIYRIGFLAGGTRPVPVDSDPYGGFLRGMREHGYIEGKDFIMEWRFAEGRVDVFPELAAELVRLNVDVIVLGTPVAVPAAQRTTTTIPIVMADSTDPVARGYVASLSHPGGNITGQASSREEITLKQFELLMLSVSGLSRVGLAVNPDNSGHLALMSILEEPARRLDVAFVTVKMQKPQEIAAAFEEMIGQRVGAILFPGDAFFFSHRKRLAELANNAQLPTMFAHREYVGAGGLMSYGQSLTDFYRTAAYYVDEILKGRKPADLPIQLPARFFLMINLKTAKALGRTIPPGVLAIADEVIG